MAALAEELAQLSSIARAAYAEAERAPSGDLRGRGGA